MNAGGASGKSEESLAKKRARDRRAQQNQRNKRNEQVKSLQEQLTRMESRMLQLSRDCDGLRQENEHLRARQEAVAQLVASWSSDTPSSSSGENERTGRDPAVGGLKLIQEASSAASTTAGTEQLVTPACNLEFWSHWSGIATNTSPALTASSPTSPPKAPWSNIPAHSASDVIVTESFRDWLKRPDLVQSSPDQPQPTELLYGSKTNFLANVINQSLRSWPCRDPERLAAGWLIYNQIKWMLKPSPENYARLQEFQVPVPEQLNHGHPYFVDFVHWPELRARMIQHVGVYNPQDVLGMFLCCVKLRWPWGQNFLEPEENGTLKMRQDFFDTITSLDGWGLTDDFIQRFPLLVQGLNFSAMRYRVC